MVEEITPVSGSNGDNRTSAIAASASAPTPNVGVGENQKPSQKKGSQTSLGNINNPLLHFKPKELEADVKKFANQKGLKNIEDLLIKGAKVARDPGLFRRVAGLSDEVKDALGREKTKGFWQQTKELKVIILTCSIAAVIQGWDQASINGANLGWPQEFGLDIEPKTPTHPRNAHDIWIFAFINAAPFLFAALAGVWLTDFLNEYVYGRRGAIFFAALFCFFSVIGSACAQNWPQLLVCRVLLGIGIGAKSAVVPVFAAEASPSHIRGTLVMNWQLFVAFGSFLGFSANLAVFNIKNLAWRLQLAAACLPAIPLMVLIFVCPESPRFLMKKGDYKKCFAALCYLNETPLQAARELYYIHAQIRAETILYQKVSPDNEVNKDTAESQANPVTYPPLAKTSNYLNRYLRRLWQLFSIPRIRHATISAFVVMISQQLCGVNIIAFYSSTVFTFAEGVKVGDLKQLADVQRKSLWLGWGFGLTTFLFAYFAYGNIDKYGRRALLLITVPCLAITILAAGFSFKISSEKAHIGLIAFFIILYGIFYAPGLGPVPFTYSAEVFPLINREVGMSFAVSVNMLGAGVLSLTVPFLHNHLNAPGLLGLFAGLNLIAFILIFLLLHETRKLSLEELNDIFAVDTKTHMKYQIFVFLPWLFNYYVTGEEKTKLVTPYRWKQKQDALLEKEKSRGAADDDSA